MYTRAANLFKITKNWCASGNAFCQAANLYVQMESKINAANNFKDAGNAFKNEDPQEGIYCLHRAIELYTDMGRFHTAAKCLVCIAEMYEAAVVNIEKAVACYEQAADYYKDEESASLENRCLLKVATNAIRLEQYPKAIEIFERVGNRAMNIPLLKHSANDHFFKAALCHVCVDASHAKFAVQKYEEMSPAFANSKECQFVKKLLRAYEEHNAEAFNASVKEFGAVFQLDQLLVTMLLRIQKSIEVTCDLC